ncbi:MAG: response regulator, partial [Chlorobi bacterium]|nr:response regulator [Chlorobiota bacterium]
YVYGDRLLFIQVILAVIDFFYNHKKGKSLNINIDSIENKKYFSLKLKSNEINVISDIISSLNSKYKIIHNAKETSFIFDFYFENEDNKTTIQHKKAINLENNKSTKLKDANILLVEDDAINSKIMTLNLNKHVNKVIIAENGKDALDKFSSTKIDLILMDIRMPLMDGYKTTKKIRAAESIIGYKIPIIAVTANVSEETRARVFEVGMNDYTTKPVNFNILLKKMQALLS